MKYSRDEQETVLIYNNETRQWDVYSNVPKHIRKLSQITETKELEVSDGAVVSVKGTLSEKQVSMKKIRVLSDKQKQEAAERMRKAREANE